MVFNQAITYTEYTTEHLSPNVTVPGTPTEPITATLTIPNNMILSTGLYGSSVSYFSNNTWSITGNKTDVDLALADVYLQSPAIIDSFSIAIDIRDANDVQIESGTYNLAGSELGSPIVITSNPDVLVGSANDVVDVYSLVVGYTTSSATNKATVSIGNDGVGRFLSGKYGNAEVKLSDGDKTATLYGLTEEVQAFLNDIKYERPVSIPNEFEVDVFIEGPSQSSSTNVKILLDSESPQVANINQTHTYTEDVTFNGFDDITIIDVNTFDVFTATLTLSDPSVGVLTTGTFGSTTSTFNNVTGVWEAEGNINDVNDALAALVFEPADDYELTFTMAVSVTDNVTTPITGTITMNATPVADVISGSNMNATHTFTEDVTYAFNTGSKHIIIDDPDLNDTITATLTMSTNDDSIGTLSSPDGGTFTANTGVWTISDTVSNVNTALESLVYNPTSEYNTSFTISSFISDGTTDINGSLTMTGLAIDDPVQATNLSGNISWSFETQNDLLDIVITDPDLNDTITATLTLSDNQAGTFSTPSSGSVTSTFNAGVFTVTSSQANISDINTILANVTFTPATNYMNDFTINTQVTDGTTDLNGTWSMNMTLESTNVTSLSSWIAATVNTLPFMDILTSRSTLNVTLTFSTNNDDPGSISTPTIGTVTPTWNSATGVWNASGNKADVLSILQAIEYTADVTWGTDFTISTHISDGVQTLSGTWDMKEALWKNWSPVLDGPEVILPTNEGKVKIMTFDDTYCLAISVPNVTTQTTSLKVRLYSRNGKTLTLEQQLNHSLRSGDKLLDDFELVKADDTTAILGVRTTNIATSSQSYSLYIITLNGANISIGSLQVTNVNNTAGNAPNYYKIVMTSPTTGFIATSGGVVTLNITGTNITVGTLLRDDDIKSFDILPILSSYSLATYDDTVDRVRVQGATNLGNDDAFNLSKSTNFRVAIMTRTAASAHVHLYYQLANPTSIINTYTMNANLENPRFILRLEDEHHLILGDKTHVLHINDGSDTGYTRYDINDIFSEGILASPFPNGQGAQLLEFDSNHKFLSNGNNSFKVMSRIN